MANLTNDSLHTATPTNEPFTQAGLTVGEATFSVGDAVGPVGDPYSIINDTMHTASMTNQPLS